MKIAIIGPQGVGKSSLLHSLKADPRFKHYIVREEAARQILAAGHEINEGMTTKAQLYTTSLYMQYALDNSTALLDRSIVDCYAYCKWSYEHGFISKEVYDLHASLLPAMPIYYDCLIYIRGEENQVLVDDGVRSIDPVFYTEIRDIFEAVVPTLEGTNILTISGFDSIASRTDYVLTELQKLQFI